MLDTVVLVETPEGVELSLRVAGPWSRFTAWLLDLGIRIGANLAAAMVLGLLGKTGAGLLLLVWFALEWGYPVLFEVLWEGRTPGKKALGLRVIREDGTPVDWASSALRNLLRAADFLPLANVAALVSMSVDSKFRRLGDLAAGTLVVYEDRDRADPRGISVEPKPPPFALSLEEQRAIVDFARRAPGLTDARARELALVAEPLMAARGSQDPASFVRGIGAWISGRRPGDPA